MYVLLIYALLTAAVCCIIFRQEKRNEKNEWILYGIIAVFFLIRFSIGQDTEGYSWMFHILDSPLGDLSSHMMRNPGYTFLNYLVKITFGEFRYFVLLSNLIILGLCSYTVYKHSRNSLFSLLLFVGSGMLEVYYGSGMKQGLAMAVYLFAFYEFLPKKKYLWYIIFILAAASFQEVALILLIVPLLERFADRFAKNPYRITLIVSFIAWCLSWLINKYAIRLEYMITEQTGYAPVWTHLLAYFHRRSFSYAGSAMEIVFLLGVMLMCYFADKSRWDRFRWMEIMTFVYSCVLYYLFAGYSIMSRASDLIQIIQLIMIPNLLSEIPGMRKKLAAAAAVFAVNAVLLYTDISVKCTQVSENGRLDITVAKFPYITVFEKARIDALFPEENEPEADMNR